MDIRLVDDGDGGHRLGYQPKDFKKADAGYKPKTDPTPSNPPKGKKTEGDSKK